MSMQIKKDEVMANGIISVFKANNIGVGQVLDSATILMEFKESLDGLQMGVDWLMGKGFVLKCHNNEGCYKLTSSGHMQY